MKSRNTFICALALALSGVVLQPRALAAPDRAQFIRECLDSAATPETPKFDDYTKGSYHIDKLDLVQGIEKATESQPGRLRAVIIFGPTRRLWTYHVLVALSEGGLIRLHSLVMPHARITGKGTRTLSRVEFEERLSKLTSSAILPEGDPTSIKADDSLSRDFAYDMLVSVWTDGRRSLRFAELRKLMSEDTPKAKEAGAVLECLSGLLKGIKTTYPKEDERKKTSSEK